MKIRGSSKLWAVATLAGLEVLFISVGSIHFYGRRYAQNARRDQESPRHPTTPPPRHPRLPKTTPVMVDLPPRDKDAPPTEKLIPVSLHCKMVCTSSFGGDCYPLDKAILVYRDKVPTKSMTFLQNAYPMVYVPKPKGKALPASRKIERCVMDEHFPDMQLIPGQDRCAVVGNSGILNGSGCGDDIDGHDFVIRANLPPVHDFETDVGNHTDMTAINIAMLYRLYSAVVQNGTGNLQDNRVLLERIHRLKRSVLWYPKSLNKLYLQEKLRKLAVTLKDNASMNVHIAFGWKSISVEKEWGLKRYATMGFNMFASARLFCRNITLYGFHPFNRGPNGERIPHHYYEDVDFKYQTVRHDFLIEYNKFKELEAKGEIQIQTRPCQRRPRPVDIED